MSPRPRQPDRRERILDMAATLFDERGIQAVGMQQIIDSVGCGKAVLYREFPTKDDLVVAYLERYTATWDRVRERVAQEHRGDPAAQLVAVVRWTTEQAVMPSYRGCPVHNTHAEFPDPGHPAHAMALRYAERIRSAMTEIAREAGAADPHTLADRLVLVIDGVNVSGATLGNDGPAQAAVALAEDLVRTATT
jgi:AcrR family transcriptional regulator